MGRAGHGLLTETFQGQGLRCQGPLFLKQDIAEFLALAPRGRVLSAQLLTMAPGGTPLALHGEPSPIPFEAPMSESRLPIHPYAEMFHLKDAK